MLMNSKKFAQIIEALVKEKRMSYLDAVLKYCEENDIDTASVGPLINKSLKEKIKEEAEESSDEQQESVLGHKPVKPIFNLTSTWLQFKTQLRIEIKRAFRDPYFLAIA